ncbi:signal peptidase I [bacterium]|nr:signal peptidase I [bacterium]
MGLIAGLLIRKYLFFTAVVTLSSMEPTLLPGDRLLVERVGPNSALRNGEIIVLEDPFRKGETIIKRLIAQGDSWVAIYRGTVFVNGQPLYEPYIQEPPLYILPPVYVPPGYIFVLGDNRNRSEDSSDYGPIRRDLVKGVVVAIIWPLKRIKSFY